MEGNCEGFTKGIGSVRRESLKLQGFILFFFSFMIWRIIWDEIRLLLRGSFEVCVDCREGRLWAGLGFFMVAWKAGGETRGADWMSKGKGKAPEAVNEDSLIQLVNTRVATSPQPTISPYLPPSLTLFPSSIATTTQGSTR